MYSEIWYVNLFLHILLLKILFYTILSIFSSKISSNHIWQVLLFARLSFYKIDTKLPWNPEAAVL